MSRFIACLVALVLALPVAAQQEMLLEPLDILPGTDGAWTITAIDDWTVFTNTTNSSDVKFHHSGFRETPRDYSFGVTVDLRPMLDEPAFGGLLYNYNRETRTYIGFTIDQAGVPLLFNRTSSGFTTVPVNTSDVARMDGTDRLAIEVEGDQTTFMLNGVVVFRSNLTREANPLWGILTIGAARAAYRDFVSYP